MYRRAFLLAAALSMIGLALGPSAAHAPEPDRISGPHSHENLTLYFIHGPSTPGPVPLTLAEALASGSVEILETGDIQSLSIENRGDRPVFVQQGDIVKGGKQDRVLTFSLLLPAHSGAVPIGAYCVESGRWAKRGLEDERRFSSSKSMLSDRRILQSDPSGRSAVSKQQAIWNSVANVQRDLSKALEAPVSSSRSKTSLQLTLENERLNEKIDEYVEVLQPAAGGAEDVVGFLFAVNGKINSGDIYLSSGLFRKMWPKLLRAAATEAIGGQIGTDGDNARAKPQSTSYIAAFLQEAAHGEKQEQQISNDLKVETRSDDNVMRSTTQFTAGGLLHQSFVAR